MISRKGFALAAALMALMLISALVASVFFAVLEETRIGAAAATKQLALSAAESAIEMTIADWRGAATDPIGVGGTRSVSRDWLGTPVEVSVTRLDSTLYWLVAETRTPSARSKAAKRIGAFVRVNVAPDHSITIDRIPQRWWSELF